MTATLLVAAFLIALTAGAFGFALGAAYEHMQQLVGDALEPKDHRTYPLSREWR